MIIDIIFNFVLLFSPRPNKLALFRLFIITANLRRKRRMASTEGKYRRNLLIIG